MYHQTSVPCATVFASNGFARHDACIACADEIHPAFAFVLDFRALSTSGAELYHHHQAPAQHRAPAATHFKQTRYALHQRVQQQREPPDPLIAHLPACLGCEPDRRVFDRWMARRTGSHRTYERLPHFVCSVHCSTLRKLLGKRYLTQGDGLWATPLSRQKERLFGDTGTGRTSGRRVLRSCAAQPSSEADIVPREDSCISAFVRLLAAACPDTVPT